MRSRWGGCDDLIKIEPSAANLPTEGEVQARGVGHIQTLEFVKKSRVFRGSARVVQLPRRAERDKPLKHGPDRRDADSASDQDRVRGALDQWKIVARRRDFDLGADAQLVMQIDRRATARRGLLNAHYIAMRFLLRIAK